MSKRISDIVGDAGYAGIISPGDLKWFEGRISEAKPGKPMVPCFVRNEDVATKKEEIVRPLWLHRLTTDYGYPIERITVEQPMLRTPPKSSLNPPSPPVPVPGRTRSRALLSSAKRAVESAIEDGAAAALDWREQQRQLDDQVDA